MASAGSMLTPQRREKEETVAELARLLREAPACVVVDYRGLRVGEEGELRRQLREAHVTYRVVKNTLVELAARQAGVDGLDGYLRGPTAVAFSLEEPTDASRVLARFARDHQALRFKGGVLDGRVVGEQAVRALADLPPREVLLAQVAGAFAAPLALVGAMLSAPIRGLVTVAEQLAKARAEAAPVAGEA